MQEFVSGRMSYIFFIYGLAACVIAVTIWYYHQALQAEKSEKRPAAGVVLALVLILALGWFWTDWAGRTEAAAQRARLLGTSQYAVTTVDPEMVKALAASTDDLEKPVYRILKSRLQHLHSVMPSVRFISLMRKVEGKIVFLADSEPSGSKNESPPGRVYDTASSRIHDVFASGKGSVDDFSADRGGTWISAYAPLNDGRTGELVAVLGVSQSARDFNSAVELERLKRIVFVGLVCLFVLFGFVYWQKLALALEQGKEGGKLDPLSQWGMAAIVVLLGATITLTLFLELRQNAWEAFQTAFRQHAIIRAQSVSRELERQLDRLDGLHRFMAARELVGRDEFSQYVAPLLKGTPIRDFEWVPRVAREERVLYESRARQDGVDGFQVYEKDASGKKVSVSDREEYFPVYYLEPSTGNEAALGFDLISEPVRRAAMEKSRDTGQPVATPPLVPAQAGQKKTEALVFIPVYAGDWPGHSVAQRRQNLKGFVLAVYAVDEFLKGMYSRTPPEGLACLIEDPAAPADSRVLYRHALREGTVDWSHPLLKYEMSLEMPDRQWRVTIVPGTEFVEKNLSRAYWWILLIGLWLTGLLAAFLNVLVTARYRAESLVRSRTRELFGQTEELRKSREEVSLILDSTAEAIYGIDLDGRCTFCNPACLRMLGYADPDELIGKNMHRLSHHSHANGASFPVEQCRIFQAYQGGQGIHADDEVLWKADGKSFPAEYWSYPQRRDGKIVGAVVTFVDITERKKAEQSLRESEDRYRHIASAITDYIYTVFIEDGKSVRINYTPACLAVTGYSAGEFRADPLLWIKIVLEEDRPLVFGQIEEILSGRKDVEPVEHRLIHKNGRACWVKNTIVLNHDARGRLVSYDGLISDITARREAEKILEDQKKVLDEHAIVSKADAQGRMTYANDKFCLISGYSREELIGQDHRIVNSGYHPKSFFANLWKTILGGKVWQGNIRNRARDGSFYWVQATIVPFMDERGRVKEYISARTDITRNVENEERLEQAMQVKSNFISTVSHELRTPLASIKSSIDILMTEAPGELTGDQKTFLGRVKSNIDRLARLINDVLDLSKLESGKMPMNLLPLRAEEMVNEVVEMQRAGIRNRAVVLETQFADGLPVLFADRDRLVQVFNNLINNALKFTNQGKVSIAASCDDQEMVRFCVSDTGAGIRAEDLPKLFQKFQQVGGVSQQVSGTGLGLAISKEIVERHGGRIWAESEFGQGSSFIFTVPVKQLRRILVVDDDPGTLRMIKAVLEGSGQYKVESAADGFAAGQKYLEFDPHVVILDIGLPQLSGFDVCARIKRGPRAMNTKIIMMSIFTDETEKKARASGADGILNKPVDPGELLSKVESLG